MSLINEEDNKISLPNTVIIISIVLGFVMFGFALYLDRKDAYIPLGGVLMAALSAVGIKAYKKTS